MNINIAWFLVGTVLSFVGLPLIFWVFWFFTSYKYKARIAKQVGNDPTNVIWVDDKFKVVEKNGIHQIKFLWQKGSARSFPYNLWSKHSKKKPKWSDEEWNRLDMSKHIKQGLVLFQSTEGEFHPMVITKDESVVFKILPQDNRAFVVDSYRDINDMTLTPRKAYIAVGILALGVVVFAICFVLFLVYLNEANVAMGIKQAGNSFLSTAQGVVGA